MAAFINALYEEGTRADVLRFLQKQRAENGRARVPDSYFDGEDKQELLSELIMLWDNRPDRFKKTP